MFGNLVGLGFYVGRINDSEISGVWFLIEKPHSQFSHGKPVYDENEDV